ncbi:hypothetical protein MASR1M65_04250 [Saprospiraceae bacterium]
METAAGMLNAAEIAGHPRLKGMVMGTNDLAKELGSPLPAPTGCRCRRAGAVPSGGQGLAG